MAQFNPYLHFDGIAEEAFMFYKSVFGGEFTKFVRYKDFEQSDEYPIAEQHLNKMMYIALPLGKHNMLMGSDAILQDGNNKFNSADNFHIAISADSAEEAKTYFDALVKNGKIEVPLDESPWGAYFGMLRDQFGIQWTVEFESKG